MIYKAYLIQSGEGCDYYIGCAQTVVSLESTKREDAINEIKLILDEYDDDNNDDKPFIEKCQLYEINEVIDIDTNKLHLDRIKELQQKKVNDDKIKRYNDYNKMKKEFG